MDSVFDVLKNLWNLKAIAGILGISILTLFGVVASLRKTIEKALTAVADTRNFITKYKALFTSDEARRDFVQLRIEWDGVLEEAATSAEKLRMKSLAQKLRDAIR